MTILLQVVAGQQCSVGCKLDSRQCLMAEGEAILLYSEDITYGFPCLWLD